MMDEPGRNPRDPRDARNKPRPRPRTKSSSSAARGSQGARKGPSGTAARDTSNASRAGRARSGQRPPARTSRQSSARPSSRQPVKKKSRRLTRKRKILRWIGLGTAFTLVALLIVGGIAYAALLRSLPDISAEARGTDQTSVVYDRNGEVLAKLFAEQNRTKRTLDEIPIALRQAVIATEDQRYYEHKGVDPWGIARALWVDATQGKRHGGSTITQQYVVNAFVERENTLVRKIKEAILAYRVEKEHSKDEILEMYLNTIYFGHGAYGVEAASQVYFGKPVTDLTLSECAMIAGVIKSPGSYSPYLDLEAANNRRNTVLGQMLEMEFITSEAHDTAEAEELTLTGLADNSALAPYFVEYIKQQLVDEYGADMVYRAGIEVRTTLDLRMQRAAEQAVSEVLDQEGDPSAALVALDPTTGEILAMVGGRDFATQQFNVAVQGLRQPGSSFKPFVLATALEEGVSPAQIFQSAAKSFPLPNGQTWSVTGSTAGPMPLRRATEKSVNSVFAQLILDVGPEAVVETAEKMGLHEGITPVPAIALGGLSDGVSPLEMASAYGTLAAGGTHAQPYGLASVTDGDGESVFSAETSVTPAIDPAVAYLTTDILKGVITRGTGTAAGIGRPAAGKTGTTQEYRDAWFAGYTPQIACAVWVGYPDSQREMTDVHGKAVTGGSFPAEIWQKFMSAAHEGIEETDFVRPDGLTEVSICKETGLRATEWCPDTYSPLFLVEHVPDSCDVHTGPEQIEIPDLVGMTKEKALALLQQLMLLFKVTEEDIADVPAGVVGRQTPAAGSMGTTETVVTIVVSNGGGDDQPPTAAFTMTPSPAAIDQAVVFDAATSVDDGTIETYYWEFGDGLDGEGANVSHQFTDPGTFEVTLWVTDDAGQTASVTQQLVIE